MARGKGPASARAFLRWTWVVIGAACAAGAMIAGAAVFFFMPPVMPGSAARASACAPLVRTGVPNRRFIPQIGVDTAIELAGLTPQGDMEAPTGPLDAAWFDLGPRPGEVGSAVIAGHEGWKDGIAAAFDNLHNLIPGDRVYTVDGQGVTRVFTVTAARVYGEYADAADVFSSSDGKAHLNLITCEGVWNNTLKRYSGRRVVFTVEKSS